MSCRRFLPLMLLALLPVLGNAASFSGSSAGTSVGGTSGTTSSTSGDDKIILEARRDAAAFVASDGRIRGAYLEAALRHLREQSSQQAEASDMALAKFILTR